MKTKHKIQGPKMYFSFDYRNDVVDVNGIFQIEMSDNNEFYCRVHEYFVYFD